MKKTFTLFLALTFLLGGLAYAQNCNGLAPKANRLSAEKTILPTKGTKAIDSATTITCSSFWINGTQTLEFTLTYSQLGGEYMDGVRMVFPTGMVPNVAGTSNPLTTDVDPYSDVNLDLTITNQTVFWGVETCSGWGAYVGGTISFQVNVTNTGLVGDQTINYTVYGDCYGDVDPHTITGSVVVQEAPSHDLAIIEIEPSVVLSGATITPQVTVQNYGANNETTWSLTLSDGGTYNSTVNNTPINAGQRLQIDMDNWTPADGIYTLTATLTLAGDENTTNNTLTQTVYVLASTNAFAWDAYHDGGVGATGEGPINVVLATGVMTQIAIDESDFIAAADYVGDEIYGTRYANGVPSPLVKIDPATGAVTHIGGGMNNITGFTYDVTTETAYVMDFSGMLSTIDLRTGVVTNIGGHDSVIIALACDINGNLFAISLNDYLTSVDKTTGAHTRIGDLGINISYAQDICFDRENNILYGALYANTGGIYIINTTTGAATLIAEVIDELTGFAIPYTLPGPHVVSKTPIEDELDVFLNAEVSVTFDVPIFPVDLSGISITPDPGNVLPLINGDVLTIAHDDFDYNTTYTVHIPAGAVSDGVEATIGSITWSFKTMLDSTACNIPVDLIISDIQEFQATISWRETGAGTSWRVAYGAPGFDPEIEGSEIIVNATTATLTQLQSNTTYQVYVQAICDENTTSDWGGPISFKTECSPVTALPYIEDFEGTFPPDCWTFINNHAMAQSNWHYGTGNPAGNALAIQWSNASLMDEWAISPELDLSAITGSISLTFDFFMSYYWHVDPNNGADVMLKVSTDGGANWTEIWKEEDYGTFESFTWYTTSVPFDAYAGQSNVKFAFHFLGTDGAETMIDNIKIDFETGSSINDNATNQVSVYPNPSNGLVNVQVSEKSIVTLVDLTGRVIATYQVNGNETVSFNQAAAGVYILKVESKNHVSTHKLIVQ